METPDTTARWVAQARHGHGSAWDSLFRRFAPVVHGILLGRLQSADAEDLVQQVFETAWRRLPDLREDAAFPGWLVAITRHAIADWHRRPAPIVVATEEAVDAPVPSRIEVQIDAERVLAAIRALPEAYRETLMLRLVEGLTGAEIAERTGLTAGSVRVNLHRGMAQLRAALALPAEEGTS